MTALIGNPLLLTSAPSGDDAYQIENSLRVTSEGNPFIRRIQKGGDRKKWTFSAWIKRTEVDTSVHGYVFCCWEDTHNNTRLQWATQDNKLQLYQKTGGNVKAEYKTNAVHMDPAAWYHVVCAVDTTSSTEVDRLKIYINGELQTLTATTAYPQNEDTFVNKEGQKIEIASASHDAALKGLISDVHLIDGQQLSPVAFGEFDSNTGVWNPKAFALPAPNDGSTWSSKLYTSGSTYNGSSTNQTFNGTESAVKAFDGNAATYAQNNEGSPYANWIYFRPTGGITGIQTLRVWTQYVSNIRINGVQSSVSPGTSGHNSGAWYEIPRNEIPATLTEIAIQGSTHSGNQSSGRFGTVEINGVYLVDGQTDQSAYNNPNDGRNWSDHWTGTQGSGGYDAVEAHDGVDAASGSGSRAANSDGVKLTMPTAVPCKNLRVHGNLDNGVIKVNGTDVSSSFTTGSYVWNTVKGLTTFSSIELIESSGNSPIVGRIQVDGTELRDGFTDNSFHLKFNETTRPDTLGYDSLSTTDYSEATSTTDKAEPILKTNKQGDTVVAGYRSDSNASYLKLAIPGNVCASGTAGTDQSDHVTNSSSSEKNFQFASTPEVIGSGKYYDRSIKFDGDDDALFVSDHADWTFGDSDFCIEGWFYVDSDSSGNSANDWAPLIFRGHSTNNNEFDWRLYWGTSSGYRQVFFDCTFDGTEKYIGDTVQNVHDFEFDTWFHVAATRHGSTVRLYINGKYTDKETSISGDMDDDWNDLIMGREKIANTQRYFNGRLNDIRVYKGTSKYGDTDNDFIIPYRNDFKIKELTTDVKFVNTAGSLSGTLYSGSYANTFAPEQSSDAAYSAAATAKWTFTTALTVTGTIRVKVSNGSGAPTTGKDLLVIGYDDGSTKTIDCGVFPAASKDWITVVGSESWSTIEYFDLQYTSPGQGAYLWRVEMDGKEIVDTTGNTKLCVDVGVDSPTNYGTESDPAVGGEIRGNYCILNDIDQTGSALSHGHLKCGYSSNSHRGGRGTFGLTSGKWYWEATTTVSGLSYIGVGTKHAVLNYGFDSTATFKDFWYLYSSTTAKNLYKPGSDDGSYLTSTGAPVGEVQQVMLDMDNYKLKFGVNNTWGAEINLATTVGSSIGSYKELFPITKRYSWSGYMNFGAMPFKYAAPAGYKSICTQNLDNTFDSEDTENNPSKYFDVKLWTGDGVSPRSIGGLAFQPDLVWFKQRNDGRDHMLYDAVRGVGTDKSLAANNHYPMDSHNTADYGYLSAFTSDGFTLTTGSSSDAYTNNDGDTYVGWCWDAGTAASGANTDGSINVASGNQWKNATSGFSITTWTGTDADATIGHGLGVPPEFVMLKNATVDYAGGGPWVIGHNNLESGAWTHWMRLDTTDIKADNDGMFNDTAPTNTVVSLGDSWYSNNQNETMLMLCWTSIPGYSAFGSYEGTGNASTAPFVYTGFRPRWLLTKNTDEAGGWAILDTRRDIDGNGGKAYTIQAQTYAAEDSSSTDINVDILSNGFKPRTTWNPVNGQDGGSGTGTIIYAAFAEHPFKIARAR